MLSSQEQERLILEHQGMCTAIARDIYVRLGGAYRGNLCMDDMIGWGLVAMVQAAPRYDPGMKASFGTFIRQRVRGAILDQLRGPKYWAEAGSEPIDLQQGGLRFAAGPESSPLNTLLARERREVVDRLIATLPAGHARAVRLRYLDEAGGERIAAELGVSENRVWQILRAALVKMALVAKSLEVEARAVIGDMPVCHGTPATPISLPAGSRPWARFRSTPTTPDGASGICRSVMKRAA